MAKEEGATLNPGSGTELDLTIWQQQRRGPTRSRGRGRTGARPRTEGLRSRGGGPLPEAELHTARSWHEVAVGPDDVEVLLDCVRGRPEEALAEAVDGHLARGVSLERVYLELLTPVARRLGELWEEDRCDYFQVTLLVGRLQSLVRRLGPAFQARRLVTGGRARRVFLTTPAEEQHTLGLVLVGDFFLRAGWSVSMGSPLDGGARLARLGRERFDLVGISLSRDATLSETGDTIREIRRASRNPSVRVILGGRAVQDAPETALSLGADSWASDGLEALTVATRLCNAS